MKYEAISPGTFLLYPKQDPLVMLQRIAKEAYLTAAPLSGQHLQSLDELPDFTSYIQMEEERPVLMMLDYINGRDCRVMVTRQGEDYIFHGYYFQLRTLNPTLKTQGYTHYPPAQFLDSVVE